MSTLVQDIRFAFRQARKAPAFTCLAVLALALGIGAATAIFSVTDAVLLRPLPYDQPDRVVVPATFAQNGWQQPFSWPGFQDAQRELSTFAALAGYDADNTINLEVHSSAVALHGVHVTGSFFEVFGVAPLLGRTLTPEDDKTSVSDRAVLSYEVWQHHFAADATVIGHVVRLDGRPATIVGVMPAGFRFPIGMRNAIYTQLVPQESNRNRRGNHWLLTIGRLKQGIGLSQAQSNLAAYLAHLAKAYPDTDDGRKGTITPYAAALVQGSAGALHTILAAAGVLLAISCVNLAGLLLARGVRREREMALRSAIGAPPGRLLRQLLTEALLIAFSGALAGVLLAEGMLAAMRSYMVSSLARGAEVTLNLQVLAAAVVLSVMVGIVASLLPSFRLRALDPNRLLKAGGSAGTAHQQQRLRSAFIGSQVALSLTLLVVAGLLLGAISRQMHKDLGFDPQKLVSLTLRLSPARYENRDVVATFYRPLIEQVEAIPGVQAAAVINLVPIQMSGSNMEVQIVGHAPMPADKDIPAEVRFISPDYYRTLGIALHDGRLLTSAQDKNTGDSPHVVVNEAFRKLYLNPGEAAVGASLNDQPKPEDRTQIVGVVGSVMQSLREPPMPELDYLIDAMPIKLQLDQLSAMHLLVRSDAPLALVPALRKTLRSVDPTVPFQQPEMLTEIVADQLALQRLESWIFGVFAASALTLAMIGLYGLISQEVEAGTRDIGVRMALGSTRVRVLNSILRRVAILAAMGTLAGLVLTVAAHDLIASVIPIQPSRDAMRIGELAAALILLSLAAAFAPACRAAALNPIQALRAE